MLSIPYQTVHTLFEKNRIEFVWRNSPGNEANAHLHIPVALRLEPYTMFITHGFLWSMGAFSYTQSTLSCETTMGRYCSISNAVSLFNSEHPVEWVSTSPFSYNTGAAPIFEKAVKDAPKGHLFKQLPYDDSARAPVTIGHDVWIGQQVQIKKGISIGNGAVIAAGSIVTKDVAPYHIVGGVPAKTIRQRFNDSIIERMEKLRWWDYHFTDFNGLDMDKPQVFLDSLEKRLTANKIQPFQPAPINLESIKKHLEAEATKGL